MNDRRSLTFTPVRLLMPSHWQHCRESLGAWQWFVMRLHDYCTTKEPKPNKRNPPYEWLNDTSSINNHGPDPLGSADAITGRLRSLFREVGQSTKCGDFLASLGLTADADLGKPMTVKVATNREFPSGWWFDLHGRTLKDSHNSCHPDARWVDHVALQLSHDGRLWRVVLDYGYRLDGGWKLWIYQQKGETLGRFRARVDSNLTEWLAPKQHDQERWHLRDSAAKRAALRELFWNNLSPSIPSTWETDAADELMKIQHKGSLACARIVMTPRRLATLKRWIQESN